MFKYTIPLALIGLLGLGTTGADGAQPAAKSSKLAKKKLQLARQTLKLALEDLRMGRGDEEKVYRWSRRCLEAQQQLNPKKKDRIAALQEHLQRMKSLSEVTAQLYRTAKATQTATIASAYYVAEAEIWLSEAGAQNQGKKAKAK